MLKSKHHFSRDQIRQLLLTSPDRILTYKEIIEISHFYYGKVDLLSLYNMPPQMFYKKGIRILGRTAIECCIDIQSIEIAKFTKKICNIIIHRKRAIVIDLFNGSGNLLYHISNFLNPIQSIGIEINSTLYALTRRNFEIINFNSKLYEGNYLDVLQIIKLPIDIPIIFFLSPPWGKGLSLEQGLDLLQTTPPVNKIISEVKKIFFQHPLLFVIHIYEKLLLSSYQHIKNQFKFNFEETQFVCDKGLNTGLLICTDIIF